MIIVAVSGGIDSMVLLDQLYHLKHKIVIAHVNYQKREDSYIDAQVIKDYIKDKDIIFEEYIVQNKEYTKDNFQAQARQIRYSFFKEMAYKYKTNKVYVAHHKDDYLETYLFKKQRAGLYSYLGIKDKSKYQGLTINRPLLLWYKEDILAYAKNNNIPFHEDSSNSTLDYERNRIRSKLAAMSLSEKENLYDISIQENSRILDEETKIINNLKKITTIKEFKEMSNDQQVRWMYYQLKKPDITNKHIQELIRKVSGLSNFNETFLDTTIIKAYDIIYILDKMPTEYSFIINDVQDKADIVSLFKDKYNYRLKEIKENYPFEIRSITKEDLTELNIDYKKFRRKLIKDKVPFFIRDYLPVLVIEKKVKNIL